MYVINKRLKETINNWGQNLKIKGSTIVDNYISQVAPLAISSSDSLRDMTMLSENASTFAYITVSAMKLIMDSVRNNESEVINYFKKSILTNTKK
jgi:hypothetical protein